MIPRYLRELDHLLQAGPLRRRRILAEVEEHLRDAGGDEEALARFGPPEELAAALNAIRPRPPARLVAGLVLAGALFVYAAVQGSEGYLPPAPWPSAAAAPASLRVTFLLATVAILVAVGSAAATLVLPRLVRPISAASSCASLGICVGLLAAHAVLRAEYVPGSPSTAWPIGLAALAVLPCVAGLALLALPRRPAFRKLGF